jgi:hypothetical protein
MQRFEDAYIEQRYSETPDIHEITAKSREILRFALGESGVTDILQHPVLRTHVMTVRARGIAASEQRALLAASLFTAAGLNAISRRTRSIFFERALFFDPRELPPCHEATGFPMQRIRLGEENLEDVIVATGSIPLVLSGVKDIAGAAPGIYRDGGVIDYHLDLPHSVTDRMDFVNYTPAERIRIWRTVVAACAALGDEFNDVIEKGELEARLIPL